MATIEEVQAELAKRQGVTAEQIQDELTKRGQPQNAGQNQLIALQDLLVRQSKGEQGLESQIAQLRQQTGAQDLPPVITQGPPQRTLAENVQGGVEGFLGLGSQIVAEPIAGLAGLAAAADPFAEEFAGERMVKQVKELLTFKPGVLGEEAIQGIAEPLKPVGEKLLKIRKFLGDDAFEATGSPALAAMMTAMPDALLELIGGGLSKRAATSTAQDIAVEPAKRTAIESIQQAEKATGIKRLTTDVLPPKSRTAKFMQQQGELIATGQRTGQQAERIKAVEGLLNRFNVTDGARFEGSIVEGLKASVDARKSLAGQRFDSIVNRMEAFGEVPLNKTKEFAQKVLDKELKKGSLADRAIVTDMQNIINAPNNLTFESIKSIRSGIGQKLGNIRRGAPVQGTADQGLLKALYGRFSDDMSSFVKANSPETMAVWRRADKEFSDFATAANKQGAKAIIRQGDATPEIVDRLLFSNKNSDLEFLAKNLDTAGKDAAKQRILQNILQKTSLDGIEINPNRFQTLLSKNRNQIGKFFSPAERKAIKSINEALRDTRRAQDAAVTSPTGQSVVPLFALTNPEVLIPGVVQAMVERPLIRNLLIKRSAAKTAKQRFNIDSQLQAEIDKLGLSSAAATGATTAQVREEE